MEKRTQEERRKKTQRAILDGAVACLVELGYAKTSTTEVQRRSGLSRGALLHHFPSKASLLVSAIQHLAGLRYKELEQRVGELGGDTHLADAIDLLWGCFSGDLFYVTMELRTAARADEELRGVLREMEMSIRRGLFSLSPRLFGEEITSAPGFPEALDLMIQAMIGTAMTALVHREEERTYERTLSLVERWKTLFPLLVQTISREGQSDG